MVSQKMEICGDLDVGFVAMGDDSFLSLARRFRSLADSGEATHHGNVRLADRRLSAIHGLNKLVDVRQAQVPDAQREAGLRHPSMPFNVVQRQRRFQKQHAHLFQDGHQPKPFVGGFVG